VTSRCGRSRRMELGRGGWCRAGVEQPGVGGSSGVAAAGCRAAAGAACMASLPATLARPQRLTLVNQRLYDGPIRAGAGRWRLRCVRILVGWRRRRGLQERTRRRSAARRGWQGGVQRGGGLCQLLVPCPPACGAGLQAGWLWAGEPCGSSWPLGSWGRQARAVAANHTSNGPGAAFLEPAHLRNLLTR
jgi:hypothetical protein